MRRASRLSLVMAALAGAMAAAAASATAPAVASSQSAGAFAKDQLAAHADALEALYPNGIVFDVVRDGDTIGQHRKVFRRDGDTLTVDSRMDLAITFLGLTVFTYDYRSTGTWRDGRLIALDARTDEDGDVRRVRARWTGDQFVVEGSKGRLTAPEPVMPTNHWNPAAVTSDMVLNTITGGLNRVEVRAGAIERVPTGTGPREARRFDYTGELDASVWYDERGRWVKLRFLGRDGTPVTYRCVECGGAQTAQTR